MDLTNTIITKRIKAIRKLNGITQIEMAEKLNLSKSTYNRIEKGIVPIFDDRLNSIAKVLDISLFNLLFAFDLQENEIIDQIELKKVDLTELKSLIEVQIKQNREMLSIIDNKISK